MQAIEIMFNILLVKDFYSHSNWVELGNTAPYSTLIQPDEPFENLAGRLLLFSQYLCFSQKSQWSYLSPAK